MNSRRRLPPNQVLTQGFPVLDLGFQPKVQLDQYRLSFSGQLKNSYALSFEQLSQLPIRPLKADFHCVTGWSRFDLNWGGQSAAALLEHAQPLAEAHTVMAHSLDGYTTNLEWARVMAEGFVAWQLDGGPIPLEHGGPVRLLVPQLYAWKSAKWLCELEVLSQAQLGYWEQRGYHAHGDPWLEERYS